jgi:hypothetical protein
MSNLPQDTQEKSGNLNFTLATFTYFLHDEENICSDKTVQIACAALKDAANKAFTTRVSENVAEVLVQAMGSSPSYENIQAFIEENYPEESYNSVSPQDLAANLVEALSHSFSAENTAENLKNWLTEKYPDTNFSFGFSGSSREEKVSDIRKHVFNSNRPWLAQIAERNASGLTTQWVLVEDFADTVTCMDPYPWDDIDEEYTMSIEEFMVRWELAGEGTVAFS